MSLLNDVPAWQRGIVEAHRLVRGSSASIRPRLRNIDRQTYKSLNATIQHSCKASGAKEDLDENGLPKDVAPPEATILTNALDLTSYLCTVYAFNNPMLGVPDLPDAMHVTTAIKDKLTRDATSGNWMLEMVKIIHNAVFYNFAPAEVRMTADKSIRLQALDPYNTFYDESVSPERLAQDGMWAGYTELMTAAQFYRHMRAKSAGSLTETATAVMADFHNLYKYAEVQMSANSQGYAESGVVQNIVQNLMNGYDGTEGRLANSGSTYQSVNWDKFLDADFIASDPSNVAKDARSKGLVEVSTVYRRALPEWLSLPEGRFVNKHQSDTQLPVYKLTFVADTFLVAIEPVTESHGLIPIIFGQTIVNTGNGLPLTYTEMLMPSQAYSDKLTLARISSLRRLLSTRALYDSTVISSDAIADKGSTAQIPVNGNTLRERGRGLGDSYFPLPFDASGASYLLGALGDSATYAERISGNNAQMRGGHLPGNRVASEAARVNTVGEGRFRVYAMVFQQTFMSAFKLILRANMADCVNDLTYVDAASGMKRAVTLEEYMSNKFEFDISDGLMPSSKTVSPDAVSAVLSTVVQIPELRYMKDLGIMVSMLAKAAGIEGFDRIPPPSQQATAAMQQANGANTQGANATGGDTNPKPGSTDPNKP